MSATPLLSHDEAGAPEDKNALKPSRKKVQSLLLVGDTLATTTCKVCRMSYHSHIPQDKDLHAKHHQWYLNGIPWSSSLISKSLETFVLSSKQSGNTHVTIVQIDKDEKRQVIGCKKILRMVNQELNSPLDSELWADKTSEQSKAFVLVINGRAVGVVSTDQLSEDQSRWMVCRTGHLVPNQTNRAARIGISRIWVSGKWRRVGLAERLLTCVTKYSLYGTRLLPNQVAFSQPSSSGSKLAQKFNGVVHKSGETLIPVYIEK